jgi:hypothetical protein
VSSSISSTGPRLPRQTQLIAGSLFGFWVTGTFGISLKGLKNLSWLKTSQLSKLFKALLVSWAERREIIFDEASSPDTAYILLSGLARITCRNRRGHHDCADNDFLVNLRGALGHFTS